jgi:hypothetical protein
MTSFFILLCVACARDDQPATPYKFVNDLAKVMQRIVDPAADVIWASAGTIITAEGSEELAPTTDEGWELVARNASILTEAGNLLMLPGREKGPDWMEYSSGLIDAGALALQAVEKQDSPRRMPRNCRQA